MGDTAVFIFVASSLADVLEKISLIIDVYMFGVGYLQIS